MNMKNKLILFTLVMALILSMVSVPNTGKASAAKAETLPSYDYMILGNAVYNSTAKTTLPQELAAAQKGKTSTETFSDKTEKRMNGAWIKFDNRHSDASGFDASAYYNANRKEIVIAFAGTNPKKVEEDWDTVMKRKAKVQKTSAYNLNTIVAVGNDISIDARKHKNDAQKYVKHIVSKQGNTITHPTTKKKVKIESASKIVMTGHSLGGYLVQVAGVYMVDDKDLKSKFKAGYTFNSLAVAKGEILTRQWNNRKSKDYSKFAHFRITNEFVHAYNNASKRELLGPTSGLIPIKIGQKYSSTQLQATNHSYPALYKYAKWE